MSRFGPRVLPVAVPGFIENLSNAFQQGYGEYERQRDRKDAQDARDQQQARQEAIDASQGILAPVQQPSVPRSTPAEPVAPMPQFPGYGDEYGPQLGDELAEEMRRQPPVAPTPQGVVPGAFDARVGRFARPRLPVQTLPGGYSYDPNVRIESELAKEMGTLAERQRMDEMQRSGEMAERVRALQALRRQPGYENLTDAMIEAAALDDELFRDFARPVAPKAPLRGTPEYVRMLEDEAAARARGEEGVRPRATAEREDPIEQSIRQTVARVAAEGIEDWDDEIGGPVKRRVSEQELRALAGRLRRVLTGAAPSTPADRWEELVEAGMNPTEATAQVRREFPE